MLFEILIEKAQKLAADRDGYCLSTINDNPESKLKWKCNSGHIWDAHYQPILSGKWCPYCCAGLYERICKCYFEEIFKKPFLKVKPDWLKNSNNNKMELDGYCQELNLAFEHNGEQHYSLNAPKFISSQEALDKRKKDDEQKVKLCKENNVTLIVIPELNSYLSVNELRQFIKTQLQKFNFPIPENFDNIKINLSKAYSSEEKLKYKQLQEIAIKKNGKLLSKYYKGIGVPLKWHCNVCDYNWQTNPNCIIKGTWCPKCAKKAKGTIKEMQELAKLKGGTCLSKKYKNCHEKLKWQCNKCNYIWEASALSIKNCDHWCPQCAGQAKPKEEYLISLANDNGGTCLNVKEYTNAHSKLKWRCSKGHEWEASYANVNYGKWCPYCAVTRRADLRRTTKQELDIIAANKDGKCLSEYTNVNDKILWECKFGHQFKAFLTNVKSDHWCPYCSKNAKLDINTMQELAKSKNGICLSTDYKGIDVKLIWQCNEGHIFELTPNYVRNRNIWCKICKANISPCLKNEEI